MDPTDEDADRNKLQEDMARAAKEEAERVAEAAKLAAKKEEGAEGAEEEGAEGAEEEGAEEAEKEAEKEAEGAEVKPAAEKVCVQLVNSLDDYAKIGAGTTIAIKQDSGTYTVFKKDDEKSPDFSPGNTYQQIVELSGGKRRKTAKRGGKSSKRGRKSAKRGRKSVKRGRKGKGSRRSKK